MKLKISDIIALILFIITAILVFWYIFGDSPTFEQVIIGFVFTALFTIVFKIGQFGTQLNYQEKKFDKIERDIKDSFIKAKDDMSVLKEDINLIKKKLKI